MAAPVPSLEPSTINAGDTIAWTRSFSDYLPATWTLSYAFRLEDGSGLLNVTGAASGTDHAMTISAASSTAMKAGAWLWNSYVTSGAERYTVGAGLVTVKPNLAKIDFSTDLRSPAKIAYDNALAAWQSVKLGQSVTLNGRTYTQHNLDSLIRFVDRCRADYAREVDAAKMAQTGVNPRHIGVRLKRV